MEFTSLKYNEHNIWIVNYNYLIEILAYLYKFDHLRDAEIAQMKEKEKEKEKKKIKIKIKMARQDKSNSGLHLARDWSEIDELIFK